MLNLFIFILLFILCYISSRGWHLKVSAFRFTSWILYVVHRVRNSEASKILVWLRETCQKLFNDSSRLSHSFFRPPPFAFLCFLALLSLNTPCGAEYGVISGYCRSINILKLRPLSGLCCTSMIIFKARA